MRILRICLLIALLLSSSSLVAAQEVTPEGCTVSMESGYPSILGECSTEELLDLWNSLSNNMGIDAGVNPSVPLPVMGSPLGLGFATIYPGADENLVSMILGIPELDPNAWLEPFNVNMNGYSSKNGYEFDAGQPITCEASDGCNVTVEGVSFTAWTGDSRIPSLGYECFLAQNDGCATIIVNVAPDPATFVVGSPGMHLWSGAYFNGGDLVDDTGAVLEPTRPALQVSLWAMASNLVSMLTSEPGNCALPEACHGANVTIFVTSGPTPLARLDMSYWK